MLQQQVLEHLYSVEQPELGQPVVAVDLPSRGGLLQYGAWWELHMAEATEAGLIPS